MKTQKINSVSVVAILFVAFLCFSACDGKKESSTEEQSKSSVSKAPSMDIHTATFLGNLKAVQQHINAGSDLNEKDEYGSSPLIIATTFGKADVAKALIEGGADLNGTNNEGSTPLHNAAFFCRTEIVEALLEKGAEKNVKNIYGSTAFESISGPFEDVQAIYDQINKDLGPLGLKLDYKHLESTRPIIAEMLK